MKRRFFIFCLVLSAFGLFAGTCNRDDKGTNAPDTTLPPPSTERLWVWFYEPMSDVQVESFARANALIVPENTRSLSRVIFAFDLDRSIVPRRTTAAMYAEMLKAKYPDLVRSAGPERYVGTAGSD